MEQNEVAKQGKSGMDADTAKQIGEIIISAVPVVVAVLTLIGKKK